MKHSSAENAFFLRMALYPLGLFFGGRYMNASRPAVGAALRWSTGMFGVWLATTIVSPYTTALVALALVLIPPFLIVKRFIEVGMERAFLRAMLLIDAFFVAHLALMLGILVALHELGFV